MEQTFDFVREQKELYQPMTKPGIVDVPEMTFFAVDGAGDPNEADGAYAAALQLLYALSYTVKMSGKGNTTLPGFFPYRMSPLEGFWRLSGGGGRAWTTRTRARWSGQA